MKKLPIGIQTFREIREDDYVYVDKTKEAYELIENYKYVFLSRPRRFGKSLFLDTLKEIFEGNKELFEGLYIYDKYDWSKKHPVIKISFSGDFRTNESTKSMILDILKSNQRRLGVICENETNVTSCFRELIEKSYEKYGEKVVILVDEYDKPILDVIDKLEVAKENRETLRALYTVIKDNDAYIRFTFLTGVSRFSRASIFSGLNMLEDISLNPEFGNICGYTQRDLDTVFKKHLQGADLKKVKQWYNGYNFLKDSVYNPFDILLFIKNKFLFDNYWFSTGTPSFLIKLIEKNRYFLPKLSNLVVGKELVDSFDIENLNLEVILFQAGYLTIDRMLEDRRGGIKYKLRIPNKEVKQSLNDYILDYLFRLKDSRTRIQDDLYDALMDARLELLKESLYSIFASIPYNNYVNNDIQDYEGFYASVVYVYLQSLGIDVIGEDVTNLGRIDLTVIISDKVYVIEFKVDGDDALEHIKEKRYYEKYLSRGKDIYLVGINFDSSKKNISSFEWEKL
ncbi:ATP-binding protein [Deferribacter autotrophicus]|uniref:ATP-binding protein n=1 Tax=Deferribacter autotrophicus TaxID=500465 RepID=A0A5A8F8R0_9BACT|nr:ATP-binding protein [Deferribacter autotrophicus]KAA0259111.1 ATP-binding protein [Deferribacter autotrophicus]